jgi:hypothetical protein
MYALCPDRIGRKYLDYERRIYAKIGTVLSDQLNK